jgi:hypothetical protein
MKYLASFVILLYITLYVLSVGAMEATRKREFPTIYNQHECREDQAFAIAWSAIPLAPVIAPFMTGFYQDGFKYSCKDAPVTDSFGNDN